ncbi:MAG: hypothetical protein ACK4G1_08085, partial [Ignavibacteria bacterium]
MKNYLLSLLRKENRILLLIIIGFLILFVSAIIFPNYLKYIENNWDLFLDSKIEKIKTQVQNYFDESQKELIEQSEIIQNKITPILKSNSQSILEIQDVLFKIFADRKKGFSFQILNEKQDYVAYSDYKFASNLFIPIDEDNEFRIIKSNFKTFLVLIKKIDLENKSFYLISARELESNYHIKNEFIKNVSIAEILSKKFDLKISIIWDTLYFSIRPELINKNSSSIKSISFLNHKTAFYIAIQRPDKDLFLSEITSSFGNFQKILFLLILTVLIYSLFRDIRSIQSRILKAFSFSILIWLFRIVLLILEFPSFLFSGDIINPSIYASRFLYGLVKSPVELFLTATTLALNLIIIFISFKTNLIEKKN